MDAPDTAASSSQDTAAMDAQLLDAPTRPNTPTMDASSSQDTAASSLSASRATVGVKRGRPDPAQPEAVEAEVCTICLSALVDGQSDGEAIRTLRCGHRFHEGCIEEWLPRQALCPCCRQPVRPPCRVIIRGIELEVAFADESEPCLVLISRACAAFADRYPVPARPHPFAHTPLLSPMAVPDPLAPPAGLHLPLPPPHHPPGVLCPRARRRRPVGRAGAAPGRVCGNLDRQARHSRPRPPPAGAPPRRAAPPALAAARLLVRPHAAAAAAAACVARAARDGRVLCEAARVGGGGGRGARERAVRVEPPAEGAPRSRRR